jgi:hypothetical protein
MGGDVAVAGAAPALKKHVSAGVKRKAAAGAVAPAPARLQKVVLSGGKASGAASSSPPAVSTDGDEEEDSFGEEKEGDDDAAETTDGEEPNASESPSNSAGGDEGKNSARRRKTKCHYCQSMSDGADCGLVAGKCPNRPCDSCGGRHRLGRCRKSSPSGSGGDSQNFFASQNSLASDDGTPAASSSGKPSEEKKGGKGVKPQQVKEEWGYPQPQQGQQGQQQQQQRQQQQQHPVQGPDTSRSAGSTGSGKSSGMRRASKPNLTLETSASALESAYPGFDPVLSPTLATITPRNMMVGDSPLPSPTAAHDLINSLASPFGGAIGSNNLFASLGGLNLMHPFFPNTPMAACMTPMNGLGLQGKLGDEAEAVANAQALSFFNSMGGAGDMSGIFLGGIGMPGMGMGMGGAGGFFNGSGLTTTISPRKVAIGAHDDGTGLGHGYGPAKKQQMQLMQQVVQPPPLRDSARNGRVKGLSINTLAAEREAAGARSANNTGTHASVATHSSVDSGEADSPNGKNSRQYTMLRKRSACHYCSEIGQNCGLVAGKCPNRPCKTCQGRHRHGRCRLKKPLAPVVPALAPAQPAK